MHDLIYYLWLGMTGFWNLITFQSVTANTLADHAFRIATILCILLTVALARKPRWWIAAIAFSVEFTAIIVVCFLLVAPLEKTGLAAAGYVVALIQLLVVFVILLLIGLAVLVFTFNRKPASTEENPEA